MRQLHRFALGPDRASPAVFGGAERLSARAVKQRNFEPIEKAEKAREGAPGSKKWAFYLRECKPRATPARQERVEKLISQGWRAGRSNAGSMASSEWGRSMSGASQRCALDKRREQRSDVAVKMIFSAPKKGWKGKCFGPARIAFQNRGNDRGAAAKHGAGQNLRVPGSPNARQKQLGAVEVPGLGRGAKSPKPEGPDR